MITPEDTRRDYAAHESFAAASLAILLAASTVAANQSASSAAADDVEPLARVAATDPSEAPETFRLQNGFRAELIAAEPLVTDPVDMQYDENGLAYVVEMNDYPYSDPSHDKAWEDQTSKPLGRIRVLEDTSGDGRYDKSTVFAEQLSWPSGIALWKGGVYVAATPDVLYLKDTDGDRQADIRRKVFSGFRKYNVQAVMNNFRWGLDHHLYAAGSGNGGTVKGTEDDQPVRMGRADFRFDPRDEHFELISGGARFGNSFDDWGNRFLCNIRNPVQQVMLPARYLSRNRFLPVASTLNDVAPSGDAIAVFPISPPEPWRVINAERQAADAATKPPHDSTVASGFVTSSSGITIYRGGAYPPEFQGNAFIGEVAGNLVMRYKLTPAGPTFNAERAHDNVEFLASTDNWFRPVNFVNAPDGTLHVLDMYRETIEHPWSMPDDLKARVDLTSGRDRGRIYRLVPPEYPEGFTQPPRPNLGETSAEDLAGYLENPNSWWRETAHRLIFERQDAEAVTPLRSLLLSSPSPLTRLHAIWSLQGLTALTVEDLATAMVDADPHVREHAIRLAEPRLGDSEQLRRLLFDRCTVDSSARVRFQTALTLGEISGQQATNALAQIARRDAADPWIRTAILSSLNDASAPFLVEVLQDRQFASSDRGLAIISPLAEIIGAQNHHSEIEALLGNIADGNLPENVKQTIVRSLGAGLKRAGSNLIAIKTESESVSTHLIERLLNEAAKTALDTQSDVAARLSAIEFLQYADFNKAREAITPLFDSRHPQFVQIDAINALTSFPNAEVATILIDQYPRLTPAVQTEAIAGLLGRQTWIVAVLDAIEQRIVPASHISWVRRDIYMKSGYDDVREKAIRLFAQDRPSPRQEVIERYQVALKLDADRMRGQRILENECLICHRLGKRGHDVGPNLATVERRTAAELLTHIIDPNREVSPNYLEYVVANVDGRIETGIVVSETPTGITLRQAQNKQKTILRENIEEIRSSGQSLMPEGLEKKLSPQDMADLLAYLKSRSFDAQP